MLQSQLRLVSLLSESCVSVGRFIKAPCPFVVLLSNRKFRLGMWFLPVWFGIIKRFDSGIHKTYLICVWYDVVSNVTDWPTYDTIMSHFKSISYKRVIEFDSWWIDITYLQTYKIYISVSRLVLFESFFS